MLSRLIKIAPVVFLVLVFASSARAEVFQPTLSEFGIILTSEQVTVSDEMRAAQLLLDYFAKTNETIPDITPREEEWLESEIASGNLNRIIFVLSKPEGCFGLYKRITSDIVDSLNSITNLNPKYASALSKSAPEDIFWLRVQEKLANPFSVDVLNCPSKHIKSIRPFNPISDANIPDDQGTIILAITSQIMRKFVLDDPRFLAQNAGKR